MPGSQKLTNDDVSRSGTVCFIAAPIWQQWASKGVITTAKGGQRWSSGDTGRKTVQSGPKRKRSVADGRQLSASDG